MAWVIVFFLSVLLGLAIFFIVRFVRIIFIIEDDISEAIEVFDNTEKSIQEFLELPMFFESPQVQKTVSNSLDSIRASKLQIGKIIGKFTERSKYKYIEEIGDTSVQEEE